MYPALVRRFLYCALLLNAGYVQADVTFKKSKLATVDSKKETAVAVTLSDSGMAIRDRTGTAVNLDLSYAAMGRISYLFLDRRRVAESAAAAALTGGLSAVLLFTKSQSHWLVIEHAPGDPAGVTLLHLDKTEFRTFVALLDAKSGKHVELLGPGSVYVDATVGSHDEDATLPFPPNQVLAALKSAMESVGCKVGKSKPNYAECHRGLHATARTGWGGEEVTARLEPAGNETRVRIRTGRGFGHDWSTPIYKQMLKDLGPPPAVGPN